MQADLPTERCEQILQEVPLPPVRLKDDARVAFMKDEAALITANGRIGAGRSCIADVRQKYHDTGQSTKR